MGCSAPASMPRLLEKHRALRRWLFRKAIPFGYCNNCAANLPWRLKARLQEHAERLQTTWLARCVSIPNVSLTSEKKTVYISALVLAAVNILNFYDRHVAGALTEPIRREFHLTDTQVGLLGSVFIWLYAIVGVPLGQIADSASRKKLLAWSVIIWSALTASAAFANNY